MRIVQCGIHGFHETLGIDVQELRLFWKLESSEPGERQTAYQILLSTSLDFDKSDQQLVWNSGVVKSDTQRDVICRPENGLCATSNYYWRVTAWNAHDKKCYSSINHFFTAYPHSHAAPPFSSNLEYMPYDSLIYKTWLDNPAERWKARWIGTGNDKPCYFRKSFVIAEQPIQAIVFLTGLGHFTFHVNGEKASDHVLDPGWTNYHRTVQFVAYDVTSFLKPGENVLAAHVGNGFYAGDSGGRFFWPSYEDQTYVRYGNDLPFLAELHMRYKGRGQEVITTDADWKTRASATSLANVYASEIHDRRLFPWGWESPGFDDSAWSAAQLTIGPRGRLRYQSQPPVRLHDNIMPISKRTVSPGIVVFDLGQNMSTVIQIIVEGEAGSEITIRCGESAYEDGTVRMADPLFQEFETNVRSTFILDGQGQPESWSPEFSFTSARYIQIEGVSLAQGDLYPFIHQVTGRFCSSASERVGQLQTDKADVNQLLSALVWTFGSNLHSLHTDCPQMEKFGWLEVTHLLAPSTQYIRHVESLYTKIIDDIIDAQDPSGLVPTTAPEIRYMNGPFRDSITWGAALIILPDILDRYYGSTQTIARVYPAAIRYLDYLKQKERKGGLLEHGLGDWGRTVGNGNAQANIETAFYHRCLELMETYALRLGLTQDAIRFKSWAARIRKVYNEKLLVVDPKGGSFYTSLDHEPLTDLTAVNQAVALQFGLVQAEHRQSVLDHFLAEVEDGVIRAGEIGLKYIFATLAEAGRNDIVLRMARQEEHPSYMRFLRRGETTLPEFWEDNCRSKCHDMLGHILEWLYAAVFGVVPIEPAYKVFRISPPYMSEFGVVSGTFECPFGLIAIDFERFARGVSLIITVPVGTSALLVVPVTSSVTAGLHDLEVSTTNEVELRPGQHRIFVLPK